MVLRRVLSKKTLAYASAATVTSAVGGYYYLNSGPSYPVPTVQTRRPPPPWTPPSRKQMLDALKASSRPGTVQSRSVSDNRTATGVPGVDEDEDTEFDLLIVGGGASGAGVAVDAVTRGLKVALVERDDFSSGTSSKSTKLVHGGVRYLRKAIMELDYEQYKLVKEALHERRIFLQTAPYLSAMLPIMLPVYKYWQVPYYWIGCKLYDVLAGKENMESSYLMSKGKALEAFPLLKQDGLVGALVYYDGQHNDSRMNVALVMTAVKHGAVVANHVEVTQLRKNDEGKLVGAEVQDTLTGERWEVRAKGIVNATGPFADALLTMDNPAHKPIVQPSAGVHITLPGYYSPRRMGLLDPSTSDGRVIFFLPWQGNTIAGTTDAKCEVERDPAPHEEDIQWVLEEVRNYLSPDIKVRRGDVLSAWSGIRPLVRNPNAASTEGLVRNHMIHVSDSGLLTIAGGKWTTYRQMAEETVDEAVKAFGLQGKVTNECVTDRVRLVGSDGWARNMFIGLIQRFGLATDIAKHLSSNYGDRAWTVCALAEPTGESWPLHGIRLSPSYPFIEGEVRYAVRHEYAQTAIDFIARRCRIAFLNAQAAYDALPRVIDIMGEELGWTKQQKKQEFDNGVAFLQRSMGLSATSNTSLNDQFVGSSGWLEWTGVRMFGGKAKVEGLQKAYSRALFEAGEIDSLRGVFDVRATTSDNDAVRGSGATAQAQSQPDSASPPSSGSGLGAIPLSGEKRLRKEVLRTTLRGISGYERTTEKELQYVLDEAGLSRQHDIGFDEFVEVCAGLKEINLRPTVVRTKSDGRRVAVEKSGGGV